MKKNIKEYIWLFIFGSLLGFALETWWYYFKHGIIINKQGLLYGPFKPVYGFGIVFIVLVMKKFKEKSLVVKFLIGFILGSIYEYGASLFQEYIFGTSTWNYTSFNFNLGGRIYLPYCLAWGVLSIVCIDIIYPFLKKVIDKVNLKVSNILTLIVGIFMIFNVSLTALATFRYANRDKKTSYVFNLMDKWYPDEVMREKFPKLYIIEK